MTYRIVDTAYAELTEEITLQELNYAVTFLMQRYSKRTPVRLEFGDAGAVRICPQGPVEYTPPTARDALEEASRQ